MFEKGKSGNPGGRPAMPKELKEKLSAEAPGVLDFWIASYQDSGLKWDFRNKAAENIVAYAYGKPKELIGFDPEDGIEGIRIQIVKPDDSRSSDPA